MLVYCDLPTRPVLCGIETRLFRGADRAVLQVTGLHLIDVLLLALEAARLLRGQLARLQALFDTLLLIHVTLLVLLDRLRQSSRAHDAGREDTEVNGCFLHSRISRCR
jgi:hypothetical protein